MTEETKRNKKKWDESEAWFNKEYPDHDDGCLYGKIVVKAAYTAGADSREKRIDELEDKLANADYQLEGRDNEIRQLKKENAELRVNLKWEQDTKSELAQLLGKANDKNAELKKTYRKQRNKRIDELQKKNAELKSRECWKSCEYANPKAELIGQHIKDVQNLTKAKEIIEKLKALYFSPVVTKDDIKRQDEILAEAEQFLNSEVEK